jgi:hypothetical protein
MSRSEEITKENIRHAKTTIQHKKHYIDGLGFSDVMSTHF